MKLIKYEDCHSNHVVAIRYVPISLALDTSDIRVHICLINSYGDSSSQEYIHAHVSSSMHVSGHVYADRTGMLHIDTGLKRILQRIQNTNLALTISRYLNAFISSKLLLATASFLILFLPSSRSSFTTRKREVRVRVLKLCNRERSREAGTRDKPIPRPVASSA